MLVTIFDAVEWETMPVEVPILVYNDPPLYINTEAAIPTLLPPYWFTVTASGKVAATIADVESGNMPAGRAAFGVRMGWWDTVYCSLDTLPSVKAAMAAQGNPRWYWFAADPTGVPHLPAGAVACQYAWHSLGQCPANYDKSVATSDWVQSHAIWGETPLPPNKEMDMQSTELSDGRVVTPTVGAGSTAGHLLLWFTNKDGTAPSVIDVTAEVGNKAPNGSLYTVEG